MIVQHDQADGEGDTELEFESMENGKDGNGPDGIDNIDESGRSLNDSQFLKPSPLKEYEYTLFNPNQGPTNHYSPALAGASAHICPTQHDILAAEDLQQLLHPRR